MMLALEFGIERSRTIEAVGIGECRRQLNGRSIFKGNMVLSGATVLVQTMKEDAG